MCLFVLLRLSFLCVWAICDRQRFVFSPSPLKRFGVCVDCDCDNRDATQRNTPRSSNDDYSVGSFEGLNEPRRRRRRRTTQTPNKIKRIIIFRWHFTRLRFVFACSDGFNATHMNLAQRTTTICLWVCVWAARWYICRCVVLCYTHGTYRIFILLPDMK